MRFIHNFKSFGIFENLDEKLSADAREFISQKISKLHDEGYKGDQATAIAYSYARKAGYDVPKNEAENIQEKDASTGLGQWKPKIQQWLKVNQKKFDLSGFSDKDNADFLTMKVMKDLHVPNDFEMLVRNYIGLIISDIPEAKEFKGGERNPKDEPASDKFRERQELQTEDHEEHEMGGEDDPFGENDTPESVTLTDGRKMIFWEESFGDMAGETNFYWKYQIDGKDVNYKDIAHLLNPEDKKELDRLRSETGDSNAERSRAWVESKDPLKEKISRKEEKEIEKELTAEDKEKKKKAREEDSLEREMQKDANKREKKKHLREWGEIKEDEKSPLTVNDMDAHDNLIIDGIKYVNMVSPDCKLIKGSDNKPRIQGVKVGMMVSFINEPSGHEDKGMVEELGKTGVFVDNGSGIETYCAFKLRPINDQLVGFALEHKED